MNKDIKHAVAEYQELQKHAPQRNKAKLIELVKMYGIEQVSEASGYKVSTLYQYVNTVQTFKNSAQVAQAEWVLTRAGVLV